MPEGTDEKATLSSSEQLCDEHLEAASGGVVGSVGVQYTMFSPDGTPVRAHSQNAGIKVGLIESLKKQS